ncbi:MAG: dihydroorotase [Rikenellaceae bacterium]|nr:dihydroorotase [Rikenellaceae bacterium]
MKLTIIENGTVINEGESFRGYVAYSGDTITAVGRGEYRRGGEMAEPAVRIDASGMLVTPGVIDDQVHFREPGFTDSGEIDPHGAAAAAGGVTSYMEMPNTRPPTVSQGEWEWKMERAGEVSAVNYSFYFGADNTNIAAIRRLDPRHVCGVKVFMGSSTGNMLVDDRRALSAIFAESPVLVATHCEYEPIIREKAQNFREKYKEDILPWMHPLIRSAEACYRSSAAAVELADRYGTDLHVLHLSTARELSLFDSKPLSGKKITSEVCAHHLWFADEDYETKGNLIKWNPAVKTAADRQGLREGLLSGKLDIVATDHAPHRADEKALPYWQCPSGAPLVQHSLQIMLELAAQGVLTRETVVGKMCHAPAERFRVKGRGYLREGYKADIAIVEPGTRYEVTRDNILYKCGWSPLEGTLFSHRIVRTVVNGRTVWDGENIVGRSARALTFDR